MTQQDKRASDIRLVIAYTWSNLGKVLDFNFALHYTVEMLATNFVTNHQLPDEEYGIGEGRKIDWDEHVERFMLRELHEKGLPVNK